MRSLTASSASPRTLELTAAVHSRLGDVTQAVRSNGGAATTLRTGETLELSYAGASLESGLVRDWVLEARGVYSGGAPEDEDLTIAPVFEYWLHPARPTPAREGVTIDYSLAREGKVSLRVFDVTGRMVRSLVEGMAPAGPHQVAWDGRGGHGHRLPAGVYFYRLDAGAWRSQRKLVLLGR